MKLIFFSPSIMDENATTHLGQRNGCITYSRFERTSVNILFYSRKNLNVLYLLFLVILVWLLCIYYLSTICWF